MISIAEAFAILNNTIFPLKKEEAPLHGALNHILAEPVISTISMPPFRQSNMDGFALALQDSLTYTIIGEIKAGDENRIQLQSGQAVKIFTGAAVPDSAQAVVQIEKVTVNDDQLMLSEAIVPETNVRPMGSQIQQGATALEKGTVLTPAAVGFLAGLGFTSVKIYKKPRVGIVITGNELVIPGTPLPYGKVYESNAIMLQAALHHAHFHAVKSYAVNDNLENTKAVLEKAIAENDMVLISGGISVGDYDFVGRALESLKVETLFYKVGQKPGKPLLAGRTKETMLFALPGNPAAGLTCFYIHVLPTLRRFSGIPATYEATITKKLAHDYEVNNSRELLLKAIVAGEEVTILPHQDSSMLDSFALADVLVYLPNGKYSKSKGDMISVYNIR